MRLKYLLLLFLLIPLDIFSFSQITQLLRQPSDTAVALGVLYVVLLLIANFFIIRYLLSHLNRRP